MTTPLQMQGNQGNKDPNQIHGSGLWSHRKSQGPAGPTPVPFRSVRESVFPSGRKYNGQCPWRVSLGNGGNAE
ncbi:hypothetical protein JTE90_021068 [Oedothorax gibbosus]|uniref:Zinc finger GRF-type domain-containing protein n=1 Tax=Oedothorax gibbosus TaxID=931172 RepID=A0AAV6VSL7_9ARAC|nr:hypothetical protein JTE90_021068 [Oedothorax gibbosus]